MLTVLTQRSGMQDRFRFRGLAASLGLAFVLSLQPASLWAEPSPSETDWTYTVRPNDTLWSISEEYLDPRQPWHKLVHYNRLEATTDLKAGTTLKIPVSWLKQQPQPAVATTVNGLVRLRKAQGTSYQPLSAGQTLQIGDEIRTEQGSAAIRFADGSLLRLNEQSVLVFNNLSRFGSTGMVDTRMRLLKGSLATEVKPLQGNGARYEISTPSAVAAVRGTQFRLMTDSAITRLEVTEGQVKVTSNSSERLIGAGFGVLTGPALAPQEAVRLLAKPELRQSPTVIEQLPWNLDWQPVPEASSYVAELYRDDRNGARILWSQTDRPGWTLDQLNNGTYLLALRAVDAEGFQGVDFTAQFKIDLRALPALLVAPEDDANLPDGDPVFRWQLQRNGDLSSLEIARDSEFKQIVNQSPFHNHTQAQPAKLAPGRYFWRVATLAGGTSFNQSTTREFSVVGDLPSSRIIAVNYVLDTVRLYWKSLEQTDQFLVQVASDPQFNQILREERVTGTNVSVQLPDGKPYYARVKGIAEDFYRSEFSAGLEIKLP